MLFDYRTYFRNKWAFEKIGVSYNWKQTHKQYHANLDEHKLKPTSLKGALSKYGCNDLGIAFFSSAGKQRDDELQKNMPVIEKYLSCIPGISEKITLHHSPGSINSGDNIQGPPRLIRNWRLENEDNNSCYHFWIIPNKKSVWEGFGGFKINGDDKNHFNSYRCEM